MAFLCTGAGCDDPPTRRDRDATVDSAVERDAGDATTIVDAREASVLEDAGTDVASPTDAMAVTDAMDSTDATDAAVDGASDASDASDASAADGG